MAKPNDKGGLQSSVFDRLIDLEPQVSRDPTTSRYTLNELRSAVRRDLEGLLNSRRLVLDLTGAEEVQQSILAYGIPEISMINLGNPVEMGKLRQAIEEAIRVFEPRFLDVRVSIEPLNSTDRRLRFKIEARLDLDPIPEPLVFDSVLHTGSGAISLAETKQ